MECIAPKVGLITIRGHAQATRESLGLNGADIFPVIKALEIIDRAYILEQKEFLSVGTLEEMGSAAGKTNLINGAITIREDIFDNLYNDGAEGRATAMHELGHNILHQGLSLPRIDPSILKPDVLESSALKLLDEFNPEVQADIYACETLVDHNWLKANITKYSYESISKFFGIPLYMLESHIERLIDYGELNKLQQLDLLFEEK